MIYDKNDVYECVFLERLNRFVAKVLIGDEETLVHVKNTGRCKELLISGRKGYVVKSKNITRKYLYDLVAIYKDELLVNIDSQLPNKVVYDFLKAENIFKNIQNIKREVTYKNSRFDIYVEYFTDYNVLEKAFIEVKGVTLFEDDFARFPDAPTERGAKHLHELADALENGYKAYVFFLVQASGIKKFTGNVQTDAKFCEALKNASNKGVGILCYNSLVTSTDLFINEKVEVLI